MPIPDNRKPFGQPKTRGVPDPCCLSATRFGNAREPRSNDPCEARGQNRLVSRQVQNEASAPVRRPVISSTELSNLSGNVPRENPST